MTTYSRAAVPGQQGNAVTVEFTPGPWEYTPDEIEWILSGMADSALHEEAVTSRCHPGDRLATVRADGSRNEFWVSDLQFASGQYVLQFGRPGDPIRVRPDSSGDPEIAVVSAAGSS